MSDRWLMTSTNSKMIHLVLLIQAFDIKLQMISAAAWQLELWILYLHLIYECTFLINDWASHLLGICPLIEGQVFSLTEILISPQQSYSCILLFMCSMNSYFCWLSKFALVCDRKLLGALQCYQTLRNKYQNMVFSLKIFPPNTHTTTDFLHFSSRPITHEVNPE